MGRGKPKAEVVILPHHGKYVSNVPELLSLCHCEVAVISCGENNYAGTQPQDHRVAYRIRFTLFYNSKDGAICFRPALRSWEVKKFEKVEFKTWIGQDIKAGARSGTLSGGKYFEDQCWPQMEKLGGGKW